VLEHIHVWSLDFLNDCRQFVKIGESVSSTVILISCSWNFTNAHTASGPKDFQLVINDLSFNNTCAKYVAFSFKKC